MKINDNEFFPTVNSLRDIVSWANKMVVTLSNIYRNIAQALNNKDIITSYTTLTLPKTGYPGQIAYNSDTDEMLRWSKSSEGWVSL